MENLQQENDMERRTSQSSTSSGLFRVASSETNF